MATRPVLFVLGVFSHGDRFLVVQERDGSWYLPAGKVEEAEDLLTALARETLEEAEQTAEVVGLLGVDHAWLPGYAGKLRFVFAGTRVSWGPPKSRPDEHSRGARWLTRSEIARLPLRDPEVLTWLDRRLSGRPLLPLGAYEWYGPPPPSRGPAVD